MDAENICRSLNAHLLAINSHEEWVAIYEYIKDFNYYGDAFNIALDEFILIGWNPNNVSTNQIFRIECLCILCRLFHVVSYTNYS